MRTLVAVALAALLGLPVQSLTEGRLHGAARERATAACTRLLHASLDPPTVVRPERVHTAQRVRFLDETRTFVAGRGEVRPEGQPQRHDAQFFCSPAGAGWIDPTGPRLGSHEIRDYYAYVGWAGPRGREFLFTTMMALTGSSVAALQVRYFTADRSTAWKSIDRDGLFTLGYGTAGLTRFDADHERVFVTVRGVDLRGRPIPTVITHTRAYGPGSGREPVPDRVADPGGHWALRLDASR